MGASRKLQGEIDRVLKKVQEGVDVFDSIWNKVYDTDNANQKEKFEADLKKEIKKLQRYRDQIKTWIQSSEIKDKKVSASYEQALVDARKLIEREMERFKICEKETKTKAFSKEGLGQQPKTDPKEKAKAETREWLNNVVGELESQIDSFEAELEGLSVKKGKARPPRLTHLETSITRHKAHIIKLELILRLLDNDGLSPDQVNDVKDFLDDYVERNQDDFDEFDDVDELYSTLPLDEVEGLEDLVIAGPLVKGTPVVSVKTSFSASTPQVHSPVASSHQQSSSLEHAEDKASQDSSSDMVPKTPPPKSTMNIHSAASTLAGGHATPVSINVPAPNLSSSIQTAPETAVSSPITTKEEAGGNSTKPASSFPLPSGILEPSTQVDASSADELTKRNIMGVEGVNQHLKSPPSKMILSPTSKGNDVSVSVDGNPVEAAGISRAYSPSLVSGTQCRPGSPFANHNEMGQIRGRPEIAPDQREKFLQRLQQVQQGHGNLLNLQSLSGGNQRQFSLQQQNPLLQQSSSNSPRGGLGIGVQASGFSSAGLQQHSSAINQQSSQQPFMTDVDASHMKIEEHPQHNLADDSTALSTPKSITDEHDLKISSGLPAVVSESLQDPAQTARESADFSPGQPIQSGQTSGSLGVIGRRSHADLGAVGDIINSPSSQPGQMHDHLYNLQMLEAAFSRLPQPKDSERPRQYTPKNPVTTPSSYPQVQAPIVNNPLLWERFGGDSYGIDTLFFTFYYQQNTYQQYLAAKELKKQSWRYHRKYNTWFQRHEEPKIATDEYEQGTYVYFDFHISKDDAQHGWCQRIKTEFTFEYNYLEDELIV